MCGVYAFYDANRLRIWRSVLSLARIVFRFGGDGHDESRSGDMCFYRKGSETTPAPIRPPPSVQPVLWTEDSSCSASASSCDIRSSNENPLPEV
ncbi:unnamed protein product [Linum trigynum]|uniref:Uncharacterized protein n=1 Tax=Linum trigynum TaxID=586398 RepID=A0AAV2F9N4_9ROSI